MDSSLEFGDFTGEMLNVGPKQRINITRNKPVGFCKVHYEVVVVDESDTYLSFDQRTTTQELHVVKCPDRECTHSLSALQ